MIRRTETGLRSATRSGRAWNRPPRPRTQSGRPPRLAVENVAGPGQTSGEGFQSQWYVVNTKGALVNHAVGSGSSSPPPPSQDPGYGTTTTTGGAAWG